jgi:pimeloyl-ACP methyl ester carboxylesterase
MQTIISKDGTRIAYERSGKGSPLVLVHGTAADHARWQPVLPRLEERYTVYAIDRRGRGGSGDAEPYNIEREFDDIAAICDAINEPVSLLGHSYGAICALEGATRTHNICRLILYEPPIRTGLASAYPPEVLARIQAFLATGDRDGVVTTMLRDVAGVNPEELEILRKSPSWQGRLAAAHTIVREIETSNNYTPATARLENLEAPTLLMLGGDSPALFKNAIEYLLVTLPNSRLVILPGQRHVAMSTVPDLFINEVEAFIEEPCYVSSGEPERRSAELVGA